MHSGDSAGHRVEFSYYIALVSICSITNELRTRYNYNCKWFFYMRLERLTWNRPIDIGPSNDLSAAVEGLHTHKFTLNTMPHRMCVMFYIITRHKYIYPRPTYSYTYVRQFFKLDSSDFIIWNRSINTHLTRNDLCSAMSVDKGWTPIIFTCSIIMPSVCVCVCVWCSIGLCITRVSHVKITSCLYHIIIIMVIPRHVL